MSTRTAAIDLLPAPLSVPVARHVVPALLGSWNAAQDLDDAALLVTELVANVVDHVGGDASFTLELSLSDEWLRVAVVDASPAWPVVRELDLDSPRGRGLRMVEAIADRWGCEDHRGGKRVWFELRPTGL
jgi:anti-sigma regulatory factor (Ser/Thr protein kinase)